MYYNPFRNACQGVLGVTQGIYETSFLCYDRGMVVDIGGLTPEELKEAAAAAGRMYAARRANVETTCAYCGTPITGTSRKKYCSDIHRVMDSRRRQKLDP
jgi:hypothetical protein